MYLSFADLVLIVFLVIAMATNIAHLRNARSLDMLVRSLFLFFSRVELVVFSRTWWCDPSGNSMLYAENGLSDDDDNGVFPNSVRRILTIVH